MRRLAPSSAVLKNIAYLSMFIDHFFAVVFTEVIQRYSGAGHEADRLRGIYSAGRAIGRIAFILFAFLAAEGFRHTRSRKNYLLRLGCFALLSEIPFDLAFSGKCFNWNSQNVYFTLFLGVLVLTIWEPVSGRVNRLKRQAVRRDMGCMRSDMDCKRAAMSRRIRIVSLRCTQLVCLLLACAAAYRMHTDYRYMGVLLIFIFYCIGYSPAASGSAAGKSCRRACLLYDLSWIRGVLVRILPVGLVMLLGTWSANCLRYAGKYSAAYLFRFSMQEMYGLFALIPIALYNGKKGRQLPKTVCYGFYPVHLLLLHGIAKLAAGM